MPGIHDGGIQKVLCSVKEFKLAIYFPSILTAIDSPERSSSKTDAKYVTTECCFISISPLPNVNLFSGSCIFSSKKYGFGFILPKVNTYLVFNKPIAERIKVSIQVVFDTFDVCVSKD